MRKIVIDKERINIHGEYILEEEKIKEFFKNENETLKRIYEDIYKSKKDNNVIAILGDRGSGKSSFMKSFLENKKSEDKNIILETIDPSKFTSNCNILEIILGNLFNKFKRELEIKNEEIEYEKKRKILENFQKTIKSIKYLKNKREDIISEIDELLEISDSFNLKERIEELIKEYLQCNDEKKEKIIISIDDIDLNSKYAYEMLEDIRKYLISDKIIILIATRIEQLADVIRNNYYEEYKFLKRDIIDEEIEDKVNKYLTKLFPYDRRVYLALPFDDTSSSIMIECVKNEIKINIEEQLDKKLDKKSKKPIKTYLNSAFGELFFDKEGLEETINPLIPNNLRELVFFILKTEEILNSKEKLKKFKEFFIKYWIEEKLDFGNKYIIKKFIKLKNIKEKNDYIYKELLEKILKSNVLKNKLDKIQIRNLINEDCITLGDVRKLINILKYNYEEKEIVFAIEILYSIYFKENKFNKEKGYKLDSDVDKIDKNIDWIIFKKFERAFEECRKNNQELELEKIKEIIEKLKMLFLDSEIEDFSDRRAIILKKRKEIKEINYSNFLERIEKNGIFKEINSEKLTYIESEIKNKFKNKKENEKLIEKLLRILSIFKEVDKKEIEKKFKAEFNETIFKAELNETIFCNILDKMYDKIYKEEEERALEKDFIDYKHELIKRSFKKNKFKLEDLFNDILILIDEEDLDYFLKGIYKSEEIDNINDKEKFLGIIGSFHIYSKINEEIKDKKEKKRKIKELMQIIIEKLDERGSLKELLHLNECKPNEAFSREDVKKIDKFTEKIWLKGIVK